MTLSWSRGFYAESFLDQKLQSFMTGFVHAVAFFAGTPCPGREHGSTGSEPYLVGDLSSAGIRSFLRRASVDSIESSTARRDLVCSSIRVVSSSI